ncbi:histidine phosphatase family protein [Candidatus Thorarchaeota archaeon]|nr:MAG: histidine phosphatase family protein [Candidatus Thorarchaeota archaeon]
MGSQNQIFLRHAETQIDSNIPVSQWALTESGRYRARKLSASEDFPQYREVYSSKEPKAIATAQPFADRIHVELRTLRGLGELDRAATYTQSTVQYNLMVRAALTDRGRSIMAWETAEDALMRFSNAVDDIISDPEANDVLIVSHGIVLTLYFAKLVGKLDNAFERWRELHFLDWGITSNGKVVKDIVQD